jgi:2-alkenal reductase
VIVGVNGKPVHRLPDLTDELERVGAGKRVELRVKRGAQTRSLEVDVMDIGRKR